MIKKTFTIAMVLAVTPLLADVKVFLYPRCETEAKSLKVEDFAWVDGDIESVEKVKKIVISSKQFQDGFIDRRELTGILKNSDIETFQIIGNSVRVTRPAVSTVERNKLEMLAEHSVKKGDLVTVFVHAKRILVETHGTVTHDAVPGDEVTVNIDKKRSVKGLLHEERRVEVRI